MFEKLEKIENIIFSYKELTIKVVVSTGIKSSKGNKLSPLYAKQYKSQKYVDRDELETLTINPSKYLVLSYSGKGADRGFEEVFISYPHLSKIKRTLVQVDNFLATDGLLLEQGDEIFINAKYSETCFKIENLANDKSIMFTPNIVTDVDGDEVIGCELSINSEYNNVSLPFDIIEMIKDIIKGLNLNAIGNETLLMGMIYESSIGNNTFSNNYDKTIAKPKKPVRKILHRKEDVENEESELISSIELVTPTEEEELPYMVDIPSNEKPINKVKNKSKKSGAFDNLDEIEKTIKVEDLFNDNN